LGVNVSARCSDLECMYPQMTLACAAIDGVPGARDKLFRVRRVTDTVNTTDNGFALAWLLSAAPIETVRLAACASMKKELVRGIAGTGIPPGTRESTITVLQAAHFSEDAAKAIQAEVLIALKAGHEEPNMLSPCMLSSRKWPTYAVPQR